jgi:hypothetical protein
VRNAYKILVGNLEGKRLLGDLGIDGKKMLKFVSFGRLWQCRLGSCGSE